MDALRLVMAGVLGFSGNQKFGWWNLRGLIDADTLTFQLEKLKVLLMIALKTRKD